MERYERRYTNPVLIWISGLVLGVLFGLIILGWWLFPVVWVDASPSDLLYDFQVGTLRTTIEAYGYNSDTTVAKARYDSLGENKETALAEIVQNPEGLPPTLVNSFVTEVAGLETTQLAAQPIQQPKTTTGLNTWIAIIGAIIFLLIGGLLTFWILRGRKEEPALVEEQPLAMETPVEVITTPEAVEAEVIEMPEELPQVEPLTQEIEPEGEIPPIESGEQEGLDLPPFLATAGAAAIGIAAADRESSGENDSGEGLAEEAIIAEQAPEDVLLPEAELEEFPFEELAEAPEADEITAEFEADMGDSTPGGAGLPLEGAGTAFAATAMAASELFEGEPAETVEEEALEIPAESTIEAPETLSEETGVIGTDLFEESTPLVSEEEQVVHASDPVEIKMRKRLDYVEGIGPVYAEKLAQIGIETTGKLLVEGVSRKGRKEIAEKSGISERLILEWVNHVDLYRVKGVGSEYADLLEAAGVDTIPELAQRRADHLHQSMSVVNEQKRLVRQMPTEPDVADWIEQAKQLPRIIQY